MDSRLDNFNFPTFYAIRKHKIYGMCQLKCFDDYGTLNVICLSINILIFKRDFFIDCCTFTLCIIAISLHGPRADNASVLRQKMSKYLCNQYKAYPLNVYT